MFKRILEEIEKSNKIIIIRHKNPDYDAYGSQFGLYYTLKENYPNKAILLDGDQNSNNFLKFNFEELKKDDYIDSLCILVDQSSLNMLCNDYCLNSEKIICLDHHESKAEFSDFPIIKPDYSSCSELITEFIYETGLKLPKIAADSLYIGICGDSNRFYFKGTSAHTFKMAEFLISSGADILNDYKLMTKDETIGQKKMKGYVLSNFKVNDKVAFATIPFSVLKQYSVDVNFASRATVNLLSQIDGIESFLTITETEDGLFKVELRSKTIPVVNVVKEYNGGGHELACGCTLDSYDKIEEIVNKINEVINKYEC